MVGVGSTFVAFFFALEKSIAATGYIAIVGAAIVVVGIGVVALFKSGPNQAVSALGNLATGKAPAVVRVEDSLVTAFVAFANTVAAGCGAGV